MDEFSKVILRELLPSEKLPPMPAGKKDNGDEALDHLASPVLLERAAYLKKLARAGDGSAGEVLKQYPQHAIHLLVRSRNGGVEQHARFADLFFVIDGRAARYGGAIADAKIIAPGEVRGSEVQGGCCSSCARATWRTFPRVCRIRCWSPEARRSASSNTSLPLCASAAS